MMPAASMHVAVACVCLTIAFTAFMPFLERAVHRPSPGEAMCCDQLDCHVS